MEDFDELEPDVTTEPVALSTVEDTRLAALTLARQARRRILIFTRDLDPPLYNNLLFTTALLNLILRSKHHAQIRILVQDPDHAVKHGHRLLDLCRRFSSFIEARRLPEEYRNHPEAFLIADETGLLHWRYADRYEGTVNYSAPRAASELARFFTNVWELSVPDPELRSLQL